MEKKSGLPKRIAILGSTGSIGRQALQVIEHLGPAYRVVALTANRRVRELVEQAEKFEPELVALSDPEAAASLRASLGKKCRVAAGPEGQVAAATWPAADLVLVALVGFSGFQPTWEALRAGKKVALANKEALVVGGELMTAATDGAPLLDRIIPIDSEHAAIWQCLQGVGENQLEQIWLTASGGPFLNRDRRQMEAITVAEALNHPNWKMGPKITIDSATLMNKGFEVLEARWLFGLELSRIKVVIHPQSIIHSLVELIDGSFLAQAGPPDMRLPIQYALTYPERVAGPWPRLELARQEWSFQEPDRRGFPCLDLAYRAGAMGGSAPACLNAANEVAVELFLRGRLKFNRIATLIGRVLEEHNVVTKPEIEDLVEADRWARSTARKIVDLIGGER